ncbi:hypothetical protein A0H81_01994 [Grifola frondosa]|uniref:Uncharacterized protein n=1 Tax=Grifola frondosa TaxID=5627 RepID=A0A1C7MLL3_GRIFR|nr:hypothetical protein A0H81_01994 [Grifola frondosa]
MSAQSTLGLTGISEVAMDVDQTISGNKGEVPPATVAGQSGNAASTKIQVPMNWNLDAAMEDESSVPALAGTTVPTNASNPVMQWPRLSPPANTNPLPTIPRPVTMNWQLDSPPARGASLPALGQTMATTIPPRVILPTLNWGTPPTQSSVLPAVRPPPSISSPHVSPLVTLPSAMVWSSGSPPHQQLAIEDTDTPTLSAAERYRQYMETFELDLQSNRRQPAIPPIAGETAAAPRQDMGLVFARKWMLEEPDKEIEGWLPETVPRWFARKDPADVEEDDEVLLSLREEALQWMRRDAMRTFGWQEELHRLRFLIRTRAGGLTMDAVDNEVAAKPKTANDLISWETIAKERRRYERSLKRWNLPSQPYPVPETGNASSSGS